MLIMKKLYGANTAYETFISTGALVGAVIGQLFFGILCDCLGRKVVAITTIFLVVFGSIASAFVFDDVLDTTIFLWLGLCRLVLGIGVGGEYPLSAVLMNICANVFARHWDQKVAPTRSIEIPECRLYFPCKVLDTCYRVLLFCWVWLFCQTIWILCNFFYILCHFAKLVGELHWDLVHYHPLWHLSCVFPCMKRRNFKKWSSNRDHCEQKHGKRLSSSLLSTR